MRVAGIPLGVGQNMLNPSPLTVALLHFDGANGSTTFTDSSANNVTITTNGTAQLSTGTKKFGTASLYLPDNTAYVTVPVSTANFSGNDFCIECFVHPVTKSNFGNVMGHSGATTALNGFNLQWTYSGGFVRFLSGYLGNGSWTLDQTSTLPVPLNVFTHIAITRQGQILRVFIGGVKVIEINSPSTMWTEVDSGVFCIGAGAGNNRFGVGYIDEYRIFEGDAIYTSNFTPPTAPFSY